MIIKLNSRYMASDNIIFYTFKGNNLHYLLFYRKSLKLYGIK